MPENTGDDTYTFDVSGRVFRPEEVHVDDGGIDELVITGDYDGQVQIVLQRFDGTNIAGASYSFTIEDGGLEIDVQNRITIHGLIENVRGSDNDDRIEGNEANNTFFGNDGDDTLTGGEGEDQLFGGADDDFINGSVGDDQLFGESGDDVLSGAAGNDRLDGGLGDDRINLGDGVDTVVLGTRGFGVDTLVDFRAEDRLDVSALNIADFATLSRHLTFSLAGAELNFTFGGAAERVIFQNANATRVNAASFIFDTSTAAKTVVGTAGVDMLFGGLGNDIIRAGAGSDRIDGGRGADRMEGGAGDDVYFVDNAGDLVIEAAGGGSDTVLTAVSFNGASQDIERIEIVGTGRANVVGNLLDNVLIGNDDVNALNGSKGADRMEGRGGNDLYYVDNVGDVVVEAAGDGTDTVRASISYTLGANVERLQLVGSHQVNAIGNALDNVLQGNARSNVIIGMGGRDLMTGGGGADRFDFRAVSDSPFAAYDRITDLENQDVINLSAIDANTNLAGDQGFTLVSAFTRQAGQLTLTFNATGNFTVLAADVNGDGVGDFRVILDGDHRDYDNFRL